MAEISEVAEAIVFLASEKATYITGSNLYVHGGHIWTSWSTSWKSLQNPVALSNQYKSNSEICIYFLPLENPYQNKKLVTLLCER